MKTIFLFFILALPIALVAQSPAAALTNIEVPLQESRALINQGKAKDALTKLQTISASTDWRVKHLMGLAQYGTNNYVAALELLTPIISQLPQDSPDYREAVQMLALGHYVLGHLQEAIPFLEQTSSWLPNNHELSYALGMACIQTHQAEKGRAAFAKMFRVAPDSPAAHLLTAQMMIRVELDEYAEAEIKTAVAKNPTLPQAHFHLGVIAIQRSKFDEAIAYLEKEIALNPLNAMAFYRLGDVYTRQLKWDEAITPLQKSVWINPYYSGPYILLGKSYLKKRDPLSAEGMLKRAIQFDPNNKTAHYLLGQVYQQTARAEDAKREFLLAEKLQGNLDKIEP